MYGLPAGATNDSIFYFSFTVYAMRPFSSSLFLLLQLVSFPSAIRIKNPPTCIVHALANYPIYLEYNTVHK